MAKKAGGKANQRSGGLVGLNDVKKLWDAADAKQWFEFLQGINHKYEWTMVNRDSIKCKCPYHPDSTPSFSLHFKKRMGKCFACNKYVFDIAQFVAKIKECSYPIALMAINDRFNLASVIGAKADELGTFHIIQEMKKNAAIAMNSLLMDAYRSIDNPGNLAYLVPAVKYLRDVRKIPFDVVHELPVGVFGKPLHLKHKLDGEPIIWEKYEEYFKKYNSDRFYGSIVFHYNDSPGTISRFKLKPVDESVAAKLRAVGGEFSALSPIEQKTLFMKTSMPYVEDPYTTDVGLYGIYRYQNMLGRNDVNAYITEGEFDVLSVMARQRQASGQHFILLGNGGKGSTNIGFLQDFGVRTVWLVQDHPAANGDKWAQAILADNRNFAKQPDGSTLQVKLFTWPKEISGFDLDEAVLDIGYEELVKYLYTNRNNYFKNSLPWVIDACEKEIREMRLACDKEIEEIDPDVDGYKNAVVTIRNDESKKAGDIAARWIRFVHDRTDQTSYTQHFVLSEKVSAEKLQEASTAEYSMESLGGTIQYIKDVLLREYFSVAYRVNRGGKPETYLYSKKTREVVSVPTGDGRFLELIAIYCGMDAARWLEATIPDSKVYSAEEGAATELAEARNKRRSGMELLRLVFENILGMAKSHDDLTPRAQGIHYFGLPPRVYAEGVCYFVNGKNVFKGQFLEDDGEVMWTKLDNVVDNGILFQTAAGAEWSFVKDRADLEAAANIDHKKLYDDILNIVDTWKFQDHDVVSHYLAAYIMALPIMAAVGQVNITGVTGGAESGKTSLIHGLLGGLNSRSHPVPGILESAALLGDVTSAGAYQKFDRSTISCILDEAESGPDKNTAHDKRVRELLRIMYNLPMGGVPITRGGVTKDAMVEYELRMPFILAAITMPTDPVLLSRMFILYTDKDPGRTPIPVAIYAKYSQDEIDYIKQSITVGLIGYIPKLTKILVRLSHELPAAAEAMGIKHESNRFMEGLLTPLAVYDFVGRDAKSLYISILQRYKTRLDDVRHMNVRSDLVDACLYSKSIKVMSDSNMTDFVAAKDLIGRNDITALNTSNSGVYYIPGDHLIVVIWRAAKYGVLENTPFRGENVAGLREAASKLGPGLVMPEVPAELDVKIRRYIGMPDVRGPSDYTVLHGSYLFDLHQDGTPVSGSNNEPQRTTVTGVGVCASVGGTDTDTDDDDDECEELVL